MTVRTRFAPSPTGYLHIGGARTALFCALYAKRHGGQFILRIEDTDLARSTEESVQAILDGMDWLGLKPDEGPFFQTDRFDRYREVVAQLLESGHAYHCYCTPEEIQTMRDEAMARKEKPRYNGFWRDRADTPPEGVEPVVRFKNPESGKVVIDDLVKGEIVIDNKELDDLVIMRSDGTPTYNLTVVVDDFDMNITHVIRGDDHINNTPRQINILTAMGATLPKYAHLPMILGEDAKRLSKRHGAVSVMQYRDDGYLPEALLNYLVRLGWSHKDQELFTYTEMAALFSLEAVNRAGSVFDRDKLNWVNQQHMQGMEAAALGERLEPYLKDAGFDTEAGPETSAVAELLKDRSHTLVEMAEHSRYFYQAPQSYNEKAAKKQFNDSAAGVLKTLSEKLGALTDWHEAGIDETIQATVDQLEIGFGKVGLPLRLALTGNTATPSLGKTLELIGLEQVRARIATAVAHIEKSE